MIIARLLFPSPGRLTATKSTRSKEPTPSSNQPSITILELILVWKAARVVSDDIENARHERPSFPGGVAKIAGDSSFHDIAFPSSPQFVGYTLHTVVSRDEANALTTICVRE